MSSDGQVNIIIQNETSTIKFCVIKHGLAKYIYLYSYIIPLHQL